MLTVLPMTIRRLLFDAQMYIANRVVARIPVHSLRTLYYRKVLRFAIGKGSRIFMGAWFDCRRNFAIGANSVVNQNCRLDNRGGLTIGDNVSISADVCILTADHDMRSPFFTGRERQVTIESHVFIGTRAMVLPGVTLREGCAVAAGSVVTKDVGPYTIVAGVPARIIGERPRDLHYCAAYSPFFS